MTTQEDFEICPDCQGEGKIPIGVHYVTRDMALDAGFPEMEGMEYSYEFAQCEKCEGDGRVLTEKSDQSSEQDMKLQSNSEQIIF